VAGWLSVRVSGVVRWQMVLRVVVGVVVRVVVVGSGRVGARLFG